MKFWSQVNNGLRATRDAWQSHAYQLRNYVYVRVQNTAEPASRGEVGFAPNPPAATGGDEGGGGGGQ